VDALEAALTTRHPHWLGFCHNDLQCGNVMLDKSPPRLVRRQHAPHRTADMSISQVGLVSLEDSCRPVPVTPRPLSAQLRLIAAGCRGHMDAVTSVSSSQSKRNQCIHTAVCRGLRAKQLALAEQELSAEFLVGLPDGNGTVKGHADGAGSDKDDDGLDGTSVKDGSELADEADAVDEHRRVRGGGHSHGLVHPGTACSTE